MCIRDRFSKGELAVIYISESRSYDGEALLETFNANVPELDGVTVAGETEEARFAVLAGMGMVGHVIGYFAQIGIEDECAVQLHFDGGTFDGDFLKIPFADWPLVAAMRGGHAVGGAVKLAWIEFPVVGRAIIEHLQFAHADVGGVAFAGITNGQTIIATGRKFDFEASHKIG